MFIPLGQYEFALDGLEETEALQISVALWAHEGQGPLPSPAPAEAAPPTDMGRVPPCAVGASTCNSGPASDGFDAYAAATSESPRP